MAWYKYVACASFHTQREVLLSPGTAGPPQTVSPGPSDFPSHYSVPRFTYIQRVPNSTERSQHPVMGCKGHAAIPLLHQAERWCKPAPKQLCHSAGVTSPPCASLPLSTHCRTAWTTLTFLLRIPIGTRAMHTRRGHSTPRGPRLFRAQETKCSPYLLQKQAGSEKNQTIRARSSSRSPGFCTPVHCALLQGGKTGPSIANSHPCYSQNQDDGSDRVAEYHYQIQMPRRAGSGGTGLSSMLRGRGRRIASLRPILAIK